jgi:hypothetical protein
MPPEEAAPEEGQRGITCIEFTNQYMPEIIMEPAYEQIHTQLPE